MRRVRSLWKELHFFFLPPSPLSFSIVHGINTPLNKLPFLRMVILNLKEPIVTCFNALAGGKMRIGGMSNCHVTQKYLKCLSFPFGSTVCTWHSLQESSRQIADKSSPCSWILIFLSHCEFYVGGLNQKKKKC